MYKRSTDGGMTWSDRLPTPENWATSREVPPCTASTIRWKAASALDVQRFAPTAWPAAMTTDRLGPN